MPVRSGESFQTFKFKAIRRSERSTRTLQWKLRANLAYFHRTFGCWKTKECTGLKASKFEVQIEAVCLKTFKRPTIELLRFFVVNGSFWIELLIRLRLLTGLRSSTSPPFLEWKVSSIKRLRRYYHTASFLSYSELDSFGRTDFCLWPFNQVNQVYRSWPVYSA